MTRHKTQDTRHKTKDQRPKTKDKERPRPRHHNTTQGKTGQDTEKNVVRLEIAMDVAQIVHLQVQSTRSFSQEKKTRPAQPRQH